MSKGFTLVELIVSIAIFAILAASAYGLYAAIVNGITFYRGQATISALAGQYLEVARNLPYSQVGTLSGNPNGPLPDLPNALNINFSGTDYKIYYVVNALHDSADPDIGVQDYKQVKLYVENLSTGVEKSFITTIAPINLASLGSGGVLLVQVINKDWQSVPGATITITNDMLVPAINLTRTADSDGKWYEIGLAPDDNYHVSVIKSGYSSDQTYSEDEYPGATNPDVIVVQGQVAQTTLTIDQLSHLAFYTLDQECQPISGVGLEILGSKTISPELPKFDETYVSSGSGLITPSSTTVCSSSCGASSCCLEYDVYAPSLTDTSYMIYGTSPIQSVNLLPNSSQNFNLILGDKTLNSVLVVVKDDLENPVEGIEVELENSQLGYDEIKYTGGSVLTQSDWTGGAGQDNFTDETRYYEDDGGVSTAESPSALRLLKVGNDYVFSGELTSSTFDTGTEDTSYSSITWRPDAQADPVATEIKFQIASSNCPNGATDYPDCVTDEGSWDFWGPDGTSGTYYTISGTPISSALDNNRYARYKVFLSTTDSQKTPVLSSVSLNYVSGCYTPGQVMFSGLQEASYTITINEDPETEEILDVSGYFIYQYTTP